ncbi:MAG: hypothetical protein OXE50_14425 [Chloroflexi bacterium]|nr:hypothetical protein [Chloroflexota bacterium]
MSSLIAQIVARGYLELTDDPADGRRWTVDLTDKTKRDMRRLKRASGEVEEAIDEMLNESGADLLASVDAFEHAIDARSLEERVHSHLARLREAANR